MTEDSASAPDPLDSAFAELRAAELRRDHSRLSYAFETRLMPRLTDLSRDGLAAPWRLRLLWKALIGSAAVAGFIVAWMLSSGALDLDGGEPLWALWGGTDASINLFPN